MRRRAASIDVGDLFGKHGWAPSRYGRPVPDASLLRGNVDIWRDALGEIYPTRQRDVEDAELFIARVIVDDDGFVAGARLVRGFGGRRDEVASQMIWRFRYAPALDDAGHPTRSTLDQRFLVGP